MVFRRQNPLEEKGPMIAIETKQQLIEHLARTKLQPAEVTGPDLRDNDWSIFMADLGGVRYPVAHPCGRNQGIVVDNYVVVIRRGRVQWITITPALWVHLGREAKAVWLPNEAQCA
jgi:hypothetical protein